MATDSGGWKASDDSNVTLSGEQSRGENVLIYAHSKNRVAPKRLNKCALVPSNAPGVRDASGALLFSLFFIPQVEFQDGAIREARSAAVETAGGHSPVSPEGTVDGQ